MGALSATGPAALRSACGDRDRRSIDRIGPIGDCLGWKRPLALAALVVCASAAFGGSAWSQTVASDYMAYPKNMTLIDNMLRKDLLQLTFARWPGLSADYKLGPGDEMEIRVYGASTMNQTAKVSRSGMITVPLVGEVKAADLTAEELEQSIASMLRDRGLLRNPEVLVYITGYEAKQLFVFGAVDRPGLYQMTQELTVMDAIFMAGGIDPNAGKYGYVHRKVSELGPDWPARTPVPVAAAMDPKTGNVRMASPRDVAQSPQAQALVQRPEMAYPGTEVIRFDLTNARKGGVLEPNIALKPGDVVVISEMTKDFFYVIGDVRNPSAILLSAPSFRKVTASQAIAWVGGPSPTAKVSQGILIRTGKDGTREELKVDFLAILEGRQPDVEVRPNDIIFIPGSMSKTLAAGILGILPQQAVLSAVNR